MADGDATKTVTLEKPDFDPKDPKNIQATKYYIFNETGNIMLASTDITSGSIEDSVRAVFAEVAVFFGAMTKAISSTPNPKSKTKKNYSIYNYHALEQVIDGSGLFIHVTEEDVVHNTNSYGATFSKELLESLLGLATGVGSLAFASAMLSSIGKEGLTISADTDSAQSKVGNIVFVCEYLLGMPIVSAIVVYADSTQNTDSLQVGPCFKVKTVASTWHLHKDTYMFVTPTFIKKYAGEIDSAETDPDYNALVGFLQSTLTGVAQIDSIIGPNSESMVNELVEGTSYRILGRNFSVDKGTLKFETGAAQIGVTTWVDNSIGFAVTGTMAAASAIQIIAKDGKTVMASTAPFTVKAKV